MFHISANGLQRQFSTENSEIKSIFESIDQQISGLEKEAIESTQQLKDQLSKESRVFRLFLSGVQSPGAERVATLRQSQKEIESLNSKLMELEEKAVKSAHTLKKASDPLDMIAAKQELLALQELIAQLKITISNKTKDLCRDLDQNTLADRIRHLETEYHHQADEILQDDAKFWAIRNLFEEVHQARFKRDFPSHQGNKEMLAIAVDESGFIDFDAFEAQEVVRNPLDSIDRNVESSRRKHIKNLNLTVKIPSLDAALSQNEQIKLGFEKLSNELEIIEQALDTGYLTGVEEPLTQEDTFGLKILFLEKQINYLNLRMKYGMLEDTESEEDLLKQVELLEGKLLAHNEIADLLHHQTTAVERWMGKVLSAGIDAACRVYGSVAPMGSSKYKWEAKKWGQLLTPEADKMNGPFYNSVNTLKSSAKRLDLQINALEEQFHEVNENLNKNRWADPRYGDKKIEVKKKWEVDREILAEAIKEARATRQDIAIAIRATFLQKIVLGVGTRQEKIKACFKEITDKQDEITVLVQSDIDKDVNQAIIQKLQGEVSELREEVLTLEKEVISLEEGFQLQLDKYKSLKPPSHTLLDAIKKYAFDHIMDVVTLGFLNNQYKTPRQFEMEMEFAKAGYNWVEGLKEFVGEDTPNIPAYIDHQVDDFLRFADDYPEIAVSLAPDVAVTINRLGNPSALKTFLVGMSAKYYTYTLLRQLGRNTHARPVISEDAYKAAAKWKAFGDLVQYGPLASTTPQVVGSAWKGLSKGNLIEGVTNALMTGFKEREANIATRDHVRDLRPEGEFVAEAVLRVLSGKSSQKIVQLQHNTSLHRLAGELHRELPEVSSLTQTFLGFTSFGQSLTLGRVTQARSLAGRNKARLEEKRNDYISGMERRGLLATPIPDANLPVLPRKLTVTYQSSLDALTEQLKTELTNMVKQSTVDLSTDDIRKMFLTVANPLKLRKDIAEAITVGLGNTPQPSKESMDEMILVSMVHVSQNLKKGWLCESLDRAIENEFVSMVINYDNPNLYLSETKAKHASAEEYAKASRKGIKKCKSEVGKQLGLTVAKTIKRSMKSEKKIITRQVCEEYEIES